MKYRFINAFFAKGVSILGHFLILTVVSWLYGLGSVGGLTEFVAWVVGSTTLILHGLNLSLTRYIARGDIERSEKMAIAHYCIKRVFIVFCLFCVFIMCLTFYWGVWKVVVLVGCVACTVYSYLASGLFKGEGDAVRSVLVENGFVAFIASVIIFIFSKFSLDNEIASLYIPYFIANMAICVYATLGIKYHAYERLLTSFGANITKSRKKDVMLSSRWMFIGGVSTLFQLSVFVLVGALWMTDAELGVYRIITQIGIAIGFPLLVANSVFARPMVIAFLGGDNEIKRVCKDSANKTFFLGLVIYIILWLPLHKIPIDIIWFSESVLNTARIVGLAQLFNVATGPIMLALNMFGYEKEGALSVAWVSVISFLVFIFSTNLYGISGALFGYAFLLVSQNVVALLILHRKTGVWMLPLNIEKL